MLDEITAALAAGERVTLTGFGTFEAAGRAARTARNPRTGEALEVAATTVARFHPGATLRARVAAGAAVSRLRRRRGPVGAPCTGSAAPAAGSGRRTDARAGTEAKASGTSSAKAKPSARREGEGRRPTAKKADVKKRADAAKKADAKKRPTRRRRTRRRRPTPRRRPTKSKKTRQGSSQEEVDAGAVV